MRSGGTVPFVVLTTQRSGSVMLVQSLRSHPQVFCYHEMFRRGHPSPDAFRAHLASSRWRRVRRWVLPYGTTLRYLEDLYGSRPNEDAVGFKLMYNQLRRDPFLYPTFRRLGVRVLHLVRRNLLKTEVSAVVARDTGRFHVKERPNDPVRVRIDAATIAERLEWRERAVERHRRRFRRFPVLEVTYEDLVADREEQSMRITRFLDVEPRVLTTDWVKVNPDRLSAVVANYEELVACLRGTRFAAFLDP